MKKSLAAVLVLLAVMKGCSLYVDGRVSSYDGIERLSLTTATPYQLSYLSLAAKDRRPVILIHGSPGGAGNWSDLMLSHKGVFHWVAVDRPGFGGTRPKRAEKNLETQAEAIAALLDDLSLERFSEKPIVVGYSLGGPVAAYLAANHGDKIAAVVFAAASLDPTLEDIWGIQYLGLGLNWLIPKSLDNANVELIALEDALKVLAPRISKIQIPVAILHGEKDENVPLANVDYVEGKLSRPPIIKHIIPDLDHGIAWEGQEALMNILRELEGHLKH